MESGYRLRRLMVGHLITTVSDSSCEASARDGSRDGGRLTDLIVEGQELCPNSASRRRIGEDKAGRSRDLSGDVLGVLGLTRG